MNAVVRHLPGFVAACTAFAAVKLIQVLNLGSLSFQILAFAVAYILVVLLMDRAMAAYGRR